MQTTPDPTRAITLLHGVLAALDKVQWAAISPGMMTGASPVVPRDQQESLESLVKSMLEACDVAERNVSNDKDLQSMLNYCRGRLYSIYLPKSRSADGEFENFEEKAHRYYSDALMGLDFMKSPELVGTTHLAQAKLYGVYNRLPEAIRYCGMAATFLPDSSPLKTEAKRLAKTNKALANVLKDGQRTHDTQDENSGASATPEKSRGCFIATSVYGSSEAEEVTDLRRFRDDILLNHALGRFGVAVYYLLSPPLAAFARENRTLRTTLRIVLTDPLLALARTLLKRNQLARGGD